LALSGHFAEAIERLEAIVERPDAGVRHRQNLALAYGLGGFSERAQAVGLQDLDDLAVQRNMTLYRLIGDISGHAAKVAALGAHTGGKIVADGLVAQNATMLR
jgi:Flp pilus assembly protein TadD